MRMLPTLVLAATLCGSVLAADATTLTPQEITKTIQKIGAKATVAKLNSGSHARQWDAVLGSIESGDPRWLTVANALADGTDAGSSEALQYSLAIALPKNPAAVLRLADSRTMFTLDDVCGAPFIEPEHVFLLRYLRQTRRSLIELKDKTVEPKRIKCLAKIESLLAEERAR